MRELLHLRSQLVRGTHSFNFLYRKTGSFQHFLACWWKEQNLQKQPFPAHNIQQSEGKLFPPCGLWPMGAFACVHGAQGGSEGGTGTVLARWALLSKTCLGRKAVLKSWGSREAYLGCVWVWLASTTHSGGWRKSHQIPLWIDRLYLYLACDGFSPLFYCLTHQTCQLLH